MFSYGKAITRQKIKDIFWPIERAEVKLFIPLGVMMLCMLFNFGTLRSIKDSLVVPNIGAEAISFLKLWLVLPSTILFTLLYIKLSNLFNYEKLFFLIISSFLVFFCIFAYILFPNPDTYHPATDTINAWSSHYPHLKWFFAIAGKWSYALMYIFCELWSVITINLLFWQYANHIFDLQAARRIYPFLGVIGNLGLIIAGSVLTYFSNLSNIEDYNTLQLYSNDIQFQARMVLQPIINIVIFAGLLAMGLYKYINNFVLRIKVNPATTSYKASATKTSLSFFASLKLVLQSRYIGHIAILVLCYGLLINILEGPWKAKLRELYPSTVDYIYFMGNFNIFMGISCVIFMVIGGNILRRCSWLVAALTMPYMLAITGFIFFIFVIFAKQFTAPWFNPVYYAVLIGAVQNILSKSTKYSLFDSTKEMAYIPLSLELRTKGKAAVEVVGLKFGKSLGAFIQSSIFIFVPGATFDSIIIYLLIIFSIVIVLWVVNVQALNKEYNNLTNT